MIEEWRTIKGYEGLYEISDQGRVKSLRRNIILKLETTRQGYKRCCLSVDGILYHETIHTLVLEAFIEFRPKSFVCDHLDANKVNNFVENLEWVTQKENISRGGHSEAVRGTASHTCKLTEEKVRRIRRKYAKGDVKQRELSQEFGVARVSISDIVCRRSWKHVV